jgi:CubicO group peptidase (beta-lactamase class C family)
MKRSVLGAWPRAARRTLAVGLALLVPGAAALATPASPVRATAPATWTPDDPMDGGNDRGNFFNQVRIVRRGERVRALPVAARQITVSYTWEGKTWTLDDYMRAYNVSGVLVLKDGEVVLERYAQGRQPTDRWMSQSVAKSVLSLLYGAALQDHRLKLEDTVERYVPELKGSAYDGVTIRDLLTMSSGVKWEEGYVGGQSDLAKYYRAAATGDAVRDFQSKLPRARPPGTTFHYDTAETHLAGLVLSRAVGMSVSDYLSEKIWKPMGAERDAAWRVDHQGREFTGCCLLMTLADYARIGQFALDDGVVDGKRVLPPGWIAESTRRQIDNGRPAPAGYGFFWWIGAEAYEASGIYGQSILVYPKDRIVIAVNSEWPKPDDPELFRALGAFQNAIRDAVREAAAKPAH